MRKAIENTAASISDVPEEKLTTGHGLLQVDRLAQIFLNLVLLSLIIIPLLFSQGL